MKTKNSNSPPPKEVEKSCPEPNIKQSETEKQRISMILSIENPKKFSSHLRIMVPSGLGAKIWRSLHYLSCKAMGLREYESLMLESNTPVYPNDFPLTRGYDEYQKERVYYLNYIYYMKKILEKKKMKKKRKKIQ